MKREMTVALTTFPALPKRFAHTTLMTVTQDGGIFNVLFNRSDSGPESGLRDVNRTLRLTGRAWSADFETLTANVVPTALPPENRLGGKHLTVSIDGAPPIVPADYAPWEELEDSLGLLADSRPATARRFVTVTASGSREEMAIVQDLSSRTAYVKWSRDNAVLRQQFLDLKDYKELFSAMSAVPMNRTRKHEPNPLTEGPYLDEGSGILHPWKEDVATGIQAHHLRSLVRRIETATRPESFKAWSKLAD